MRDVFYCKKCGHSYLVNDRFCRHCGAPTDQKSYDVIPEPVQKTRPGPGKPQQISTYSKILSVLLIILIVSILSYPVFMFISERETSKFLDFAAPGTFLIGIASFLALVGLSQWVHHKKRVIIVGLLLLTGMGTAVGYSAYRYFNDQSNYLMGHQAYLEGDCAAALTHFNAINTNGLMVGDNYPILAQEEKYPCLRFQAAVEKQTAGDLSGALLAYLDFINTPGGNGLTKYAMQRSSALFEQNQPSALATLATCEKRQPLLEKNLIPQQALPSFYLACARVYETTNTYQAYDLYKEILTTYPDSPVAPEATTALLANEAACSDVEAIKLLLPSAIRDESISGLYYHCGQEFETDHNWAGVIGMYSALLMEYPDNSLAPEAETALMAMILANPEICYNYLTGLQSSVIAKRKGVMPALWYGCGQNFETNQDWDQAISFYEGFLTYYPEDANAAVVEAALARLIIANIKAKKTATFDITIPQPSGTTGNESVLIIIQNDSPAKLRIAFVGPESHVEILEPCSVCSFYTFKPFSCRMLGPTIGRYSLKPGQYEMVVESISHGGVVPWRASWSLVSGNEYTVCFFVVTKAGQ
jgi:hypothetical protein